MDHKLVSELYSHIIWSHLLIQKDVSPVDLRLTKIENPVRLEYKSKLAIILVYDIFEK